MLSDEHMTSIFKTQSSDTSMCVHVCMFKRKQFQERDYFAHLRPQVGRNA